MSRWDSIIRKHEYMFELMSDKRYPIHYGIACDGGWKDIILKLLDDIAKVDDNNEVKIFQIKEKFGSLRVYLEKYPSPTDIEKILLFISKYYNILIRKLNSVLPLRLSIYKFYVPKKKRKILNLIHEAEKMSAMTCELCGSNYSASIKSIDGILQCICYKCLHPIAISEWVSFRDDNFGEIESYLPDNGMKIEVKFPPEQISSNRILLYYPEFEWIDGCQWRYIR